MKHSFFILLLSFGFLNAAEAPRTPLSTASFSGYTEDAIFNIATLSSEELTNHAKSLRSTTFPFSELLAKMKKENPIALKVTRVHTNLERDLEIVDLALDIIGLEKEDRISAEAQLKNLKNDYEKKYLYVKRQEIRDRRDSLVILYKQKWTAREQSASTSPVNPSLRRAMSSTSYDPSISPSRFYVVSPRSFSCPTDGIQPRSFTLAGAAAAQALPSLESWSDTDV